jgi:hypothetical protein
VRKLDSIESLFNGARTSFPMTVAGGALSPDTVESLIVVYNGVMQEPSVDFTVSSTNIVFNVAPHANRDCYILYAATSSGGGTADTSMQRIAATSLSGFKVVYDVGNGTVAYASYDDLSHVGTILGVTLHAANAGGAITVVRQGQIVDATLGLTVGTLFLGSSGNIVSNLPTSGVIVPVGIASTSGIAVIDIQPAIIRSGEYVPPYVPPPTTGTAGQPIGLLLALTKAA